MVAEAVALPRHRGQLRALEAAAVRALAAVALRTLALVVRQQPTRDQAGAVAATPLLVHGPAVLAALALSSSP
jgi:hypothetical protein